MEKKKCMKFLLYMLIYIYILLVLVTWKSKFCSYATKRNHFIGSFRLYKTPNNDKNVNSFTLWMILHLDRKEAQLSTQEKKFWSCGSNFLASTLLNYRATNWNTWIEYLYIKFQCNQTDSRNILNFHNWKISSFCISWNQILSWCIVMP